MLKTEKLKSAKNKLIKAAQKLFGQKDFDSVSIRELAKKAGVNSACISYHFKDKMGLYEALLEKQLSLALSKIKSIEHKTNHPKEHLIEFFDSIVAYLQRETEFTRLVHRVMLNSGNRKIKKLMNELYIQPLIQRLIEVSGDCEHIFSNNIITTNRLVFLMVALPMYWSLFGQAYLNDFEGFNSIEQLKEDVYSFSRECLNEMVGG